MRKDEENVFWRGMTAAADNEHWFDKHAKRYLTIGWSERRRNGGRTTARCPSPSVVVVIASSWEGDCASSSASLVAAGSRTSIIQAVEQEVRCTTQYITSPVPKCLFRRLGGQKAIWLNFSQITVVRANPVACERFSLQRTKYAIWPRNKRKKWQKNTNSVKDLSRM